MNAPTITASTRRTYSAVTEGTEHRLDLWTFLGGWFVGGRFPDAAAAERAGRVFVATGRWPDKEAINLAARIDVIAEKRKAA